jgi:hypothetical protein
VGNGGQGEGRRGVKSSLRDPQVAERLAEGTIREFDCSGSVGCSWIGTGSGGEAEGAGSGWWRRKRVRS